MVTPENWPNNNVKYVNHLEFTSKFIRQFIKKQSRIARRLNLINERADWLGGLYAYEIENTYIGNIGIQYINETIGYGVFATQDLSEGYFVGIYTGVVRHRGPFYRCLNDYSFSYPAVKFGYGRFSIDAGIKGNETRYINHSYNPNCEAVSALHDDIFYIIIRTTRKILVGEQLLYSYGEGYWSNRDYPGDIDPNAV